MAPEATTHLAPALPYVSLKDREVPFDVLSLIPLETAEKFKVIAFESQAQVLKLAILHPEQLKKGFYRSLQDIGAKIHKKVEVYQTDASGMKAALRRYKEGPKAPAARPPEDSAPEAASQEAPRPLPAAVNAVPEEPPVAVPVPVAAPTAHAARPALDPPSFKLGKAVSTVYLRKMPYEYSRRQRLVCVDFKAPSTYWFVTDARPLDRIGQAVGFIERENGISAQLIPASRQEVDDLLDYYGTVAKRDEEAARQRAQEGMPEASPVSGGLVAPATQATLLTTEEAKPGLAGLFQKVAQNFAPDDAPTQAAVPAQAAPKAPEPAAAPGGQPSSPAAEPVAEPAVPKADRPAQAAERQEKAGDEGGDIGKLLPKQVESLDELASYIKKGAIPAIVAATVSFAIHQKASDIHIEAFDADVRIRYRIDGQLVDVVKLPADLHAPMVSRIKILSRLRLDETRVPQDGRFNVNFNHAQVDLRVSIMPTVHGEKVVMRILDKSKGVSSLESLGIEGLAYQNLIKAINKPFGICLATGPTGSGKSTSLYAVLQRIATPNVNVVTLEDPVEYEMEGINQSQIYPKIGYTFAEGLRSVLRQDPNIIMVGEIRDGETATMAIQSALTGHLVLSTLHTNDAAGAIPRLTNMGIEPFLITSSLNIAMGQRLVRRICPHCKEPVNLPAGVRGQIERDMEDIRRISPLDAERAKGDLTFYQGKGCDACNGKGYQGRMGIYEVMAMSDAMEELTVGRASATQIQEQAQKEGMITMYQDGLLKVAAGITTLDEVLRETSNK